MYCVINQRFHYLLVQVEIPSCFVGLILEKCELPYKNHGHVILADPSPILFYPISNTDIRCLVDVPGQRVPSISNGEMNHYLKTVIAPQVCKVWFNAISIYLVCFSFYFFRLIMVLHHSDSA